MQIEHGADVVDKNGVILGTVNYLVRNTWTGEISKFMVRRKEPNKDLFLSLDDVSEADESTIKLSVSKEELEQKWKE